jgi:hypothetical protein
MEIALRIGDRITDMSPMTNRRRDGNVAEFTLTARVFCCPLLGASLIGTARTYCATNNEFRSSVPN